MPSQKQVPIKSSLQVLMGHIKVIVCMLSTGKSIGAAGMLAEKLAVLIFLGILLCSQEQHVFTKVCQARDVFWV